MSAAVPTLDISGTHRIPLGRLVAVEWRKLSDTRAGRWLLGVTAGLLVLVLVITLLIAALSSDFGGVTAKDMFHGMLNVCSLLLPVLAVVTVTAEWGQRTTLTTFALEPRRGRVMLAKAIAVTLLAVAIILLALVLGIAAAWMANQLAGTEMVWNLTVKSFLWEALPVALVFLSAFGLAMLTLSTPFAIVVVYISILVLPNMVYAILVALFRWANTVAPFLDMGYAWTQIQDNKVFNVYDQVHSSFYVAQTIGATQYIQAITSTFLWVVLPLVLGYLRVGRSELK
jgi:hypothetical protein